MAIKRLSDIYRGDTKAYGISLSSFDLTNDTFYLTVKENDGDADPGIFQTIKSVHNQPGDDPVNGKIYIKAEKAQTALLIPETIYWIGIQWVNSSGDVKTLLKQRFKALQDITITS